MPSTLSSFFVSIGANLATGIVIVAVAYLLLIIRYSTLPQKVRRFIHPKRRVFPLDFSRFGNIEKLDKTQFKKILSDEERDILVNLFCSRNNSNPYNDPAIRLDKVALENDSILNIKISSVNFFDFLATNLSIYPSNTHVISKWSLINSIIKWAGAFSIIDRLKIEIKKYPNPSSIHDALSIKPLANIITVAILLEDSTGRVGIVRRSISVAISSGQFSVTAAGTPTASDFDSENPIISCAKRELQEELNITGVDFNFDGLVISKQKMQPVFMLSAKLGTTWEDIYPSIVSARDFKFEVQNIIVLSPEKALSMIHKVTMTDASAYHIYKYAKSKSIYNRWHLSLFKKLDIKKHILNSQN